MREMDYEYFLTGALSAASHLARKYFGHVSGSHKGSDNNQVLTEADIAIGTLIIGRIHDTYPAHNIIDEEAGIIGRGSEFTWVVDPIDGTSNFANSVPTYGIIIGLLHHNTPIAGGFALPYYSKIYIAEKGKGAYCNQKRITINNEDRPLLSELLAYGMDGDQRHPQTTREECGLLAEIILGTRNLRTSGSIFDSAMVLDGSYGAHIISTSKIWDNVGLQIVAEEAGCAYTDLLGYPMNYTYPLSKVNHNYSFCMAPPVLHDQIQDIIKLHKYHRCLEKS